MVTIGIDPHKATHQAVAIDHREEVLATLEVRADRSQTERLVGWADRWDGEDRTWAIESAGGLGYLLAQQLLARGERVLDVPSGLAARVRVLDSGSSDKSDPNDARSVAVAALRHRDLSPVRREDHAQVLRMLAKRQLELTSLRTQAVCRLHAVLMALRPGGVGGRLSAKRAAHVLRGLRPATAVKGERKQRARDHLRDVRRLDRELGTNRTRITEAVAASGTTVTEVFGVGPVVAAHLVGYTGDPGRFPSGDHYASYNGTAPREASSGGKKRHRLNLRGNRRLNHALHMAAVTQIRYRTPGRAYYERKLAEGKSKKEALRALKRRISDAVYRKLVADHRGAEQG